MSTNIQDMLRKQRDNSLSADIPCEVVSDIRQYENTGREQRSKYFACIVYPDECEEHRRFLNYLVMKPYYKVCYICHDKDIVKPHYHVLFKTLDNMTATSVKKWFNGWVSHFEAVSHPKEYVLYMLHESPSTAEGEKYSYDISDLHGNDELWKHVLVQNSHFVQLEELLSYMPYNASFVDLYNNIPYDRKDDLGQFMWENRFFLMSILREERSHFIEIPVNQDFVVAKSLHSDFATLKISSINTGELTP